MPYMCKILEILFDIQWRNRGGGRVAVEGGQSLLTGKFLLTYREKRGKEKRENGAGKKGN